MADDMMLGDTPKARKRRRRLQGVQTAGRLWKHSTLADLEGLLPAARMRDLFAFTLVRNPWDRVVSLYHWLRVQEMSHPFVPLAKALTFNEFACHQRVLDSLHASPAASYMRGPDGQERCDLYIRLEHFAQDAKPLMAHLGFAFDLPRENMSARPSNWQQVYSDRAQAAIAEACAQDITRFEYSFNDLPVSK